MKKKMLVAIVMLIILSFSVGMLAGCDEIFDKNEYRDANLVVARVNYQGMSADVKKFELEDQFRAYAYMYVNYYGMTYEAAADYIVRSLAQRELLALYAKEFLGEAYLEDVLGEPHKEPGNITFSELLTTSERDKAIRNTNDDMLSALETIVEKNINEDKENKGTDNGNKEEEEEEVEVTDPVTVKFNSDGGSEVEKQKIQKNTKAEEPADPTKSGYTFYGWYEGDPYAAGAKEFDFDTKITESITLKAKWVEYTAPRTERPEPEEEEEDKDYDPDDNSPMEMSPKFFTDEYIVTIDFSDKDFVKDINKGTGAKTLEQYIKDGIAELKKNLTESFKSYEYYLESQEKTLVITKLERYIGKAVTDVDVQKRFDRVVGENKELFANSDTSFENALKSSLATTFYFKETGYGFVNNILLKLDAESVKQLQRHINDGWTEAQLIIERNELIKQMTTRISNPDYDSKAEVDYTPDDTEDDDVEIRDPMTDPNNPFNGIGGDTTYNKDNNYNKLVEFRYNLETERYEIAYNVSEAPSMAYLIEKWPVFDQQNKKGIVTQIYESFESIQNAVTAGVEGYDKDGNPDGQRHKISILESIYWLREMATTWLYLVGDDSGSVNTESNNGGLGYLITPEGKDSGYLEEFTEQARKLIDKGIGSYTVSDSNDTAERIKGSYVVADSFIKDRTATYSDSTYVGVFVIFCSYSTSQGYDKDGNAQRIADGGVLPTEWILTYGETDEDMVSIFEQLDKELKTGKKTDRYSEIVNKFGIENYQNIQYNAKNYESIWKEAEG